MPVKTPFRGGLAGDKSRYTVAASNPPGDESAGSGQISGFYFPMAAHRDPLGGRRLDSWKEIAAFFGRAERTVKRWETERGLPIHRVPGIGRSSVFAYSEELSEWLKGRGDDLDADDPAKPEPAANESSATSRNGSSKPAWLNRFRVAIIAVPVLLVGALLLSLSFGHRALRFKALASRPAPNSEAQEMYLKGRYYWERRTPEDLNKAVDYFTQAIVKDPTYAEAYVGLADSYNLLREFGAMPPTEAYPRALSAAQRAVELNDSSAEAHTSLAFVTYWWSWKGASAEREFRRALELNPDFVRGHHWYATFLLAQGRHAEALDQIEQAQRLEPSSAAILADKGLILWLAGHKSEGLALLRQLEITQPALASPHAYLGSIYWYQKEYDKAFAEMRQSATLRHDEAGLALVDAQQKGFAAGSLRGLCESEVPIEKELVDRGVSSAYELASAYAVLGKKQEAVAYLETSLERREPGNLTHELVLTPLPDDPEYAKFQAQVREMLAE